MENINGYPWTGGKWKARHMLIGMEDRQTIYNFSQDFLIGIHMMLDTLIWMVLL